jgi:uncharacterized protein (TIGR00288 family)
MPDSKKIALLIDADNSPSKAIQTILSELARYGKVNIRRAYGNWTSPTLKGWEAVLQDYAIQPIQQYDLIKGKNAADIAMTIDSMDMLYTNHIDMFCIVTSDCDFTPLATRMLADGKLVFGFGERKSPSVFVNACSLFFYLDEEKKDGCSDSASNVNETDTTNAAASDQKDSSIKKKTNELRGNTSLINLLRSAIDSTSNNDGWAKLSKVGGHLRSNTSFNLKTYGHARLSDLVEAIGLVELRRDANKHFEVRNGKKKHKLPSEVCQPTL